MNQNLVDLLACPSDGHYPLELQSTVSQGPNVQEGAVSCRSCASVFSIASGIPQFLRLDSTGSSDIKRQEMGRRDRNYASIDQYEPEIDRLSELDAWQRAVHDCAGLRVFDAGCGVGQMTRIVRAAAHVVGLDFSWQGLTHFNCPVAGQLDLVQGDVCRLPFRDRTFDLSISSQVLEHVPSKESRSAFISQLARTLKRNGRLILSVYNWDRGRQAKGIPKEGFHESGIAYYCYEVEELRSELEEHFQVHAIWGLQAMLPKTHRLTAVLGRYNVYWDRLWQKRQVSHPYSKLLLAIGERRA